MRTTSYPLMVNETTMVINEPSTVNALMDAYRWLSGGSDKLPLVTLLAEMANMEQKMHGSLCAIAVGTFIFYKGQDDNELYVIPLCDERNPSMKEIAAEALVNPKLLADNLHKAKKVDSMRLRELRNYAGMTFDNVKRFEPCIRHAAQPRYEN